MSPTRGALAIGGAVIVVVALACGGGDSTEVEVPAQADPTPPATAWQRRTLCAEAEEVLLSCFPFGESPVGVLSVCRSDAGVMSVREGVLGKPENMMPSRPQTTFNPIDWYDAEPAPGAPAAGTTTVSFSMGHDEWSLTQDAGGLRLERGPTGARVTESCGGDVLGSLEAVRARIVSAGGVARPPIEP